MKLSIVFTKFVICLFFVMLFVTFSQNVKGYLHCKISHNFRLFVIALTKTEILLIRRGAPPRRRNGKERILDEIRV